MEDYKYLAIVEWIKDYIASHDLKPNDRFLTEKELCSVHNVSRQTVRQALMQLERDNILCRVRGSGTFIKSAVTAVSEPVRNSDGSSIGVISTYFSDYIFPHIVTGIESVLNDAACPMQLAITHNQVAEETQALKSMIARGVRGLIVEPSKSALPNPNMELYREIKSNKIPLVFFNAKYPWADFPCVAMDDETAGRIVTDYLFGCGHRDVAGLFLMDDIQGHKRYSGFINSCIAHGRKDCEKNVVWYSSAEKKDLFINSKNRILELLGKVTAVVCYNDLLAANLLRFCRDNGISVPDDISVTGIDDSSYAELCDVPLTTVRHPHRKLGEAAAKELLRLMETNDAEPKDIIFTPELVIRDSVKTFGTIDSAAAIRMA
ncbi:MAG: GntR family transcriptional regulator [Ruminiclostridium sp.]|nr:GntR family transcriptional regulator [Ruminiclostridium sp.]